jgi:hypothetical protein
VGAWGEAKGVGKVRKAEGLSVRGEVRNDVGAGMQQEIVHGVSIRERIKQGAGPGCAVREDLNETCTCPSCRPTTKFSCSCVLHHQEGGPRGW